MRLNYIDCIDCLDGLKEVPDKSVDLIVTDPPYFLSMGHAGDRDNAKQMQLKSNRTFGDLAIAKPFYTQLCREFARVLKEDGSFYFFTDWRGYAFYFPILNAELPVRNMIVWDKKSGPGSYYSFAHELIIFGTARHGLSCYTLAGPTSGGWRGLTPAQNRPTAKRYTRPRNRWS